MRITEVTTEVIDPVVANTMVGNHIEVPSKGEGDNKIIIEANTKVTADNLIPPVEVMSCSEGFQGISFFFIINKHRN